MVTTNEKKRNVNPVCRHVINLFEIMSETFLSVKTYGEKGRQHRPTKN